MTQLGCMGGDTSVKITQGTPFHRGLLGANGPEESHGDLHESPALLHPCWDPSQMLLGLC